MAERFSGSQINGLTTNRTFFFRDKCVHINLLKKKPMWGLGGGFLLGFFAFFFEPRLTVMLLGEKRICMALFLVAGHVL